MIDQRLLRKELRNIDKTLTTTRNCTINLSTKDGGKKIGNKSSPLLPESPKARGINMLFLSIYPLT